ncbi:MAG: DUF5710 domain-containing protein [Pseudonocardia sp.]
MVEHSVPATAVQRLYLDVPFAEKDDAKALGARWDPAEKRWFDHASTCDLDNPASPSSTVVALRRRGDDLECLGLADSPIVLDLPDGVRTVLDDRSAHLSSYTPEAVRAARNTEGGFWVASTVPQAARHAVTVTVPYASVRRAAVLSDGSARYVDRFGLTDWSGLLDVLTDAGPLELIQRVRAAEAQETDEDRRRERRRGKQYDATAVLVTP